MTRINQICTGFKIHTELYQYVSLLQIPQVRFLVEKRC